MPRDNYHLSLFILSLFPPLIPTSLSSSMLNLIGQATTTRHVIDSIKWNINRRIESIQAIHLVLSFADLFYRL